jgi:hypothetical protein
MSQRLVLWTRLRWRRGSGLIWLRFGRSDKGGRGRDEQGAGVAISLRIEQLEKLVNWLSGEESVKPAVLEEQMVRLLLVVLGLLKQLGVIG